MGVPVMGMLDRELRQVRAQVVPNVKREVLQNEILKNIEKKPPSIPMVGHLTTL